MSVFGLCWIELAPDRSHHQVSWRFHRGDRDVRDSVLYWDEHFDYGGSSDGDSGTSDVEMMGPPGLELTEAAEESAAEASLEEPGEDGHVVHDTCRVSPLREAMSRGRGLRSRAAPFVPAPRSVAALSHSGRGAGGGRLGHGFAKRVATSDRKKLHAAN